MIPILYKSTETKFDTNGVGPLTDAAECLVEEERNGKYELLLKYPITGQHYSSIKGRSLIKAKPAGNKEPQPFRVYDISKPMKGIVTVKAQHISYDLSGVIANPFESNNATVALQQLQTNTVPKSPFTFWTDKGGSGRFKNEVPSSVRSLLGGKKGSILDAFGGEWEFDRYLVRLWSSRGQDRGVSIRYGKNLTDVKQDENCANVRTGIYPYWKGQDGELVTLPERSINTPGTYDFTSLKSVDFSGDFQEKPTVEQLRERAQRYVRDNNIGVPSVSLKVKFAQLEQSEEYKGLALLEQVNLCDTVTVVFPALGVNATAKCNKTVYNVLLDRMERVELGDARPSITDTILDTQAGFGDLSGLLSGKIPTPDVIKSIAMQITAEILGAKGGAVRLMDTDNDGNPDTLYIADNPDPAKAVKVWRWNYEGWGASKTGYNGPFTLAATLEQGIFADFITAGQLTANLLKAGTIMDRTGKSYWNMETGEAVMNFESLKIQGVTPQEMANAAQSNAEEAAEAQLNAYKTVVSNLTSGIQDQIDKQVEIWFSDQIPHPNSYPAISWETEEEKAKHIGDLLYISGHKSDSENGRCFRWGKKQGSYDWEYFENPDIGFALDTAWNSEYLAEEKVRVFAEEPYPPYDARDLWAQSNGDLMICINARAETDSFSAADWKKAVDYVDSSTAKTLAEEAAQKTVDAYKTVVNSMVDDLQNQIDGSITTWFASAIPTASNYPASDWTSPEVKNQHLGDLYYVIDNAESGGKCYRWMVTKGYYGNTYSWKLVEDTDIAKAVEQASKAANLADSKMRVFSAQPAPPYDKGDLWAQSNGDLMICKYARASGSYSQYDWAKAVDYVNEAAAKKLATDAVANQTQQDVFNKLTNNGSVKGLYIQNGELYINATYMVTGILSDKTGKNYWDMDKGELHTNNGSIGGFTIGENSLSSESVEFIPSQYSDYYKQNVAMLKIPDVNGKLLLYFGEPTRYGRPAITFDGETKTISVGQDIEMTYGSISNAEFNFSGGYSGGTGTETFSTDDHLTLQFTHGVLTGVY